MKPEKKSIGNLKKNHKPIDPRVIVVGTGFHRQMLGHNDSLLCSWSKLLQKVSKEFNVNCNLSLSTDPVMQWEQMVCNIANYCDQNKIQTKASVAEKKMKGGTCKILRAVNEDKNLLKIYEENFLADKISNSRIHLLSLNFDSLAYHHLKPKKKFVAAKDDEMTKYAVDKMVRKSDARLLYDRFTCKTANNLSTVWHPHGHVGRVESLVLGMRDYGFLPSSYFYAFNQFKKWEYEVAGKLQGADKHHKLLCALTLFDQASSTSKITHPADNWVTRFMLCPLTFIGVGLSQVEIGMRWLLVQRTRNFSRVNKNDRIIKNFMPFAKFYGERDPLIPGVQWQSLKMNTAYEQLWKSALNF